MFNINPRQMEQIMKRMGMKSEEVDAKEVIIKCGNKEIIISNPQVTKIDMHGQKTFQIMGNVSEKPIEKFTDDDVKLVAEQAGATKEEARAALNETGDIAEAILKLKK